jgi:hypothetical protein
MSGFTAAGISPTTVTTTQQAPLGFVLTAPCATADAGYCDWVYVFNDEASDDFAAGQIIYRLPASTTQDWYGGLIAPVTVHQPKVTVLGIAQHAIANGSYGFILQKGVGLILSGGGGLTADTAFTSGGATTDGSALDYADGTSNENVAVIGHTATVIGASTTGTAYVTCG